MPGDAARAGAAALGPFQRFAFAPGQAEFIAIAADDGQIVVLAAIVEADGQAEAVGQGQAVIHGIARIDRIVLFGKMARHDGAAVAGHGDPHVAGTRLDPAFQP